MSEEDFPEMVVRQANQFGPKMARNLNGKKLKGLPRFKPSKDEIEMILSGLANCNLDLMTNKEALNEDLP